MIFASDLDQTLIYSVRSKGDISLEEMVPVELHEGRHISYMTKPALDKLRLVAGTMHFVPVTTRIPRQFNRIFGITEQLRPEYAIVSNGGTVMAGGQIDREWQQFVREAVSSHCAENTEIAELFAKIASDHWVKSSDLCDDLFYSIVVERDRLPLEALEELKKQLAALGWSYSLQGRKIYLVPEKVSKGAAIQYVKEKLASTYVYAAGDSLLDESLLLAADYAIAPVHGELGRFYDSHPHIRFTSARGAFASEELLDRILEHAGA
ncbi:HAD hydrolase family protein [Paenibacillus sp. N4]|uniref:HAD family hydrolase n=1 Tax=Paenibacillus vietnamensis TaxID=2590547 RepID=UPI001CD17BF9|nr:HAD family hydrolase [Paenibacillus vietnamensis]MCA0758183.1 HAD hydrolase family protein [Paenibacillus vietnamensis]